MTSLKDYHQSIGATLADDGIPLHYGNLKAEYDAALNSAVLLDRSHEGRILLTDEGRFELVNRMSTNKVVDMQLHEGRPTIFTNANARILHRVITYNRPEGLLVITEPGQGDMIASYLQRNIFYGDKVRLMNLQNATHHFALHGTLADQIMAQIKPELADLPELYSQEVIWHGIEFTVARRKPIAGKHWMILCQQKDAVNLHQQLLNIGTEYNLKPAGSLTFNTLRIRSGHPAGRELSQDYIPLEVGLWDEISFDKGCYTGQEIIARMESRQKLAKTIVKLQLSDFVEAPASIYHADKSIGTLTSSVKAPDGSIFAIAIIKTDIAHENTHLSVGDQRVSANVTAYAGQQPSFIANQ